MCNCINDIDADVKERYGPDAQLDTVHMVSMSSGKGWGERPKPLVFYYPKTKRDGTPSERLAKANIYFSFCPFCGVSYDEPHRDAQQPTPQGETTAAGGRADG